jgi:hypothetical protein
MEELPKLRTRVLTRYDEAIALHELRLRQQAEAGVMWAQGLFASCAQARAHFGIGIDGSNAIRHHYKKFKTSVHNEAESQAFNSFSKSSVPKCSVEACPCQEPVVVSSDSEAEQKREMTEVHWKKLQLFMRCKDKTDLEISRQFFKETGVKRSRSAINKYRHQLSKNMPALGRPTFLPPNAERKVLQAIKFMRANNIAVYSVHVAALAKRIATEIGINDITFGRGWVTSFMQRHSDEIGTIAQTIIEDLRAQYCTASKLRRHYSIVADCLLKLGWAKENPEFDPALPFSPETPENPRVWPVMIDPKFAHRIVSMDETRFTLNQCKEGKGPARRGKKTIVVKNEEEELTGAAQDWGYVVMNKSNFDCSIVGGSSADGNALPALYIFAGGFDPVEDMRDAPKCSRRWHADGSPMEAFGWHNKRGGMTDDVMLHWLEVVFLPCFPDVSKENPVLLICDGYGSHLAWGFIERCVEVGVHVILRPPHTSHVTQGEDVRMGNFHTFHLKEREKKLAVASQRLLSGNSCSKKLRRRDVMRITSSAWEEAFSTKVCMHAWQKIGLYPHFDRRPYWDISAQEVAAAKLKSSVNKQTRQQHREAHDAAAADLDAEAIVVDVSDSDAQSEDEGEGGRKKRRNNSSQFALLGPITYGAAYEKRKALEQARETEKQQLQQRQQQREHEKAGAEQQMREAGRAVDIMLTDGRGQVDRLTKQEMISLLFYLGYSISQAGLTPSSKAADIRGALLQHVASQILLPYSARAREALASPAAAAAAISDLVVVNADAQ